MCNIGHMRWTFEIMKQQNMNTSVIHFGECVWSYLFLLFYMAVLSVCDFNLRQKAAAFVSSVVESTDMFYCYVIYDCQFECYCMQVVCTSLE